MKEHSRRDFLRDLGVGTGFVVLVPTVVSCASRAAAPVAAAGAPPADLAAPPLTRPDDRDAVAFNWERGNAGAVPESYRDDINGPDGPNGHLGKHLPYVPAGEGVPDTPAGFVALMWGNPDLGHVRHPNSPRGTEGYEEGHWYDWIRVRKAVDGEAAEAESTYSDWPASGEGDSGRYAVLGGGDMSGDGGRNAIYLAALPGDVASGDMVRIHAHCRYHGEYVDFLEVP